MSEEMTDDSSILYLYPKKVNLKVLKVLFVPFVQSVIVTNTLHLPKLIF